MDSSLLAFAAFAAVLAITPGLDTMLVLRTTAVGGRRAGMAAVVGIGLGCLAWAVASALGLTAIISASRVAFEVLRVAGIAYLCWLGIRALRSSTATATATATATVTPASVAPLAAPAVRQLGPVAALRTGLVTNLLNPKVGVFYLSVLPQFLPTGVSPLAGSLTLAAIHIVEGFVWLTAVVLAINRVKGWLTRPTVRRRLDQFTGVVFLGFGLRLAFERAP